LTIKGAAMNDPLQEFREAMRLAGLLPSEAIEADGLLHRFHADGDRSGTRNGWYCLHTDGRAAGIFGSWKTGFRSTWAADGKRLNDAEHEAFAELIRAARTKAQAERRAEHEARAIEARAIWAAAGTANPTHPYLIAKGVQAHTCGKPARRWWFPCSTFTGCCGMCSESCPMAASGSGRAGLAGCSRQSAI
jgi:putative DNA primase/helicase